MLGSIIEAMRVNVDYISFVADWQLVQKYATQVGLLHIKLYDFCRFIGTQLTNSDIERHK